MDLIYYIGLILSIPCFASLLFFIFKKAKSNRTKNKVNSPAMDNLLRTFDEMMLSQKRSYIEKLQFRLREEDNATSRAILTECLKKYNLEMRKLATPPAPFSQRSSFVNTATATQFNNQANDTFSPLGYHI